MLVYMPAAMKGIFSWVKQLISWLEATQKERKT